MPVIPIITGNKITAEQYNELVTLYDAYWKGSSVDANGNPYTFLSDHSSDAVRRKGWGQKWLDAARTGLTDTSPQVSTTTEITAQQINDLITHVNAGVWHIDETITPKVLRGKTTSIAPSNYTQLTAIYDSTLATSHLNVDASALQVNASMISTTNGGTTWTSTYLASVHAFTFTSYNAARHFFNSGGQLVLDMSTSTGGTNAPSIGWNVFFEQLGIVRVSATGTTNDGDGDGDPAFSAVGNKGFYNINQAVAGYTETYSISSDVGGSTIGTHPSTGQQIDMGTFAGGIYSTRRFKLAMKGAEVAGTFVIHLKVTLEEDLQDSQASPIDIFVNSTFGVAQPLTTPIDSENSGNQYFQPDSPTQTPFVQFIERPAPTVAQTVVWTATETPESL